MKKEWGQIAMASGWEFEGPGFELRQQFQATFDPELPKE